VATRMIPYIVKMPHCSNMNRNGTMSLLDAVWLCPLPSQLRGLSKMALEAVQTCYDVKEVDWWEANNVVEDGVIPKG